MRDTHKRLQALERTKGRHGSSDPARIHEVMANNGIDAPEPQRGEDTPAWLKRVPSAALEAVLALRGGHAQP